MRSEAMTHLAELRMYLRDEHVRYGLVKERLERNLTTHLKGKAPSTSNVNQNQNENGTDSDAQMEQNEPSEIPDTTTTFSSIVDQLAHAAEEAENEDSDEVMVSIPQTEINPNTPLQIPLRNLFDFNNPYWVNLWKDLAMRNLADELEFHELVDLDAEGDVDEGDEGDITRAYM
jgi:hypothetical protein